MSKRLPKAQQLSSKNWLGKVSAGAIAGFLLSLGLCGIFAELGPGQVGNFSAQSQFTMWLMAPLWALILSFCFMFQNGLRAWLWLGGANVFLWGLLFTSALVSG